MKKLYNIQRTALVLWLLSSSLIFATNSKNSALKETNYTMAEALPQTTPPAPTIYSQDCSSAQLQNTGTIPSGEMWYWQGTLKKGTSTTYPATSMYTANGSGIYYLRPKNLSTGVWGQGAAVIVSLDPNAGYTWYLDADGDGLGDPNQTVFQCLQPFGYVSNSDDQCPDVAGTIADGGCEAEDPDNQNYVYTITARIPTTNIDSLKSTTNAIENITYFDGLGRPKQSIAIRGGGVLSDKNSLLYDWTLGNTGSTGFFNQEGTAPENTIVNGATPFGHTDLLWECKDDNNGGGSGWITDYMSVDKTKAYRYTTWVKINDKDDGRIYHGPYGVENTNGTSNGNPYFFADDLLASDTWYLLVGIVHPYNHTGGDTGVSGVYDMEGNKVIDGAEFRWQSASTTARFRNYVFQISNSSTRVHFWSPLVQKIDGSELSLNEVLSASTVITSEGATADIVTHIEYDSYGRQLKEYLPFATFSNDGRYRAGDMGLVTQTYYKSKHPNDFTNSVIADVNAYSEKTLESSPLGRVFEQTAPGEDWKRGANTITGKGYSDGHSIRFEYDTNTATEVKLYTVSLSYSNNTYTPTLSGGTSDYPAGELTKAVTKDENWVAADGKNHTTEEFKNKSGQVILKRAYTDTDLNNDGDTNDAGESEVAHDTYHVYDDYGNLSFVIPPKVDTSDGVSATELSELCYQYKYDLRNRLVEKKIPGKGWEYIIYDKLDRPLLTQDANLRANNEWLFTKYDKLGRVAYTGKVVNTRTIATMQGHVNATNNMPNEQYEVRQSTPSGLGIYYADYYFPTAGTVFTVNYYDTYVDLPTGFTAPTTVYGQAVTTNTKGLATVTKVKVLSTSDWITTLTYYDEKGRPIYAYSKNDYLGTTDIVESKLDSFTGRLLETKTTHQKTGQADVVTIDRMTYDHMDRVITQTQKVNNQTTERLVRNNYDELGQLESKLVGNGTQKGYTNVTSNITINGDLITKTGADNDWTIGLSTTGSFGNDGYVSFTPTQTNKYFMAGLSDNNTTGGSYFDINYAMYMYGNQIWIYELGVYKGTFGTFVLGDVFTVERKHERVYYKKNDEVLYVSDQGAFGGLYGALRVYDDGAVIKNLHIVDNSSGLQKVDYDYNVRGWLTNINSDADNDNDLFNFNLKYNNPTSGTALFNGNISQTSWNTANTDTSTKTYTYSYDALNRIISGIDNTGNYSLESVRYDKNGNILNLKRQGHTNVPATTFGVMDDLTYTYDTDSNKLIGVDDAGHWRFGFKDNTAYPGPIDFTYDANGNMLTNRNKDIASNIQYNHLNLPTSVSIDGWPITYVYDALGTKLRKVVNDHGNIITTDYAGNYVYENSTLQFFNHVEGYSKYDGGTTTTLSDSDFETSMDGWSGNAAPISLDNGRLKTTATVAYAGPQKYVNVSPGDRIEFNITVDKGTTESLTLMLIEHDVNNASLGLKVIDYGAHGYYRGSYVVSNANVTKVRIKVEKGNTTDNGVTTEFFIDNVTLVKVTNSGDLHSNVYQYKDHLGNVRLSYADTDGNGTIDTGTEIIEESNYYPFGLKHKGYNNVVSSNGNSVAQRWGFGGKELNSELGIEWMDFGARNFDASLGRWMNLDPLAENYISWSPYNYTKNNPIKFIDPDGRGVWIPDSEGNLIAEQGDNAETLATHLNISEAEADKMIVNQKLRETTDKESLLPTVVAGQKLEVDNNMTRSIKNSNGRSTDDQLAGDRSTPTDDNDSYGCHASCELAVKGKEINAKNGLIPAVSLDDVGPAYNTKSKKDYKNSTTEVQASEAKFGKTVITISNVHSAMYYGKSKNGTVYVYSKNGHDVKPEVSKLSKVQKIYNKNGKYKVKYHNYNGN